MVTKAEAQQRVVRDLEIIGLQLADLPEVANEWADLPEPERLSWALDWSNDMSKLEHLGHYAAQGLLTIEQQERYRQLAQQVREVFPLLERLTLYRPRLPAAERPARSA